MVDSLDRLGELARNALHGVASPALEAEGRQRILATAVSRRFPARSSRTRLTVSLAAAAVVLLAAGVYGYRRPLSYTVQGAASSDASYLGAPADKPADVRFDDGSSIRAEPGTRLRIDETYADGARVLLERGAATAHVANQRTTQWRFVAGPFKVLVTGTKFRLNWEPVTEEVELVLHEGSVEVESPLSAGRIAVRAGQRFRASLPKGSMHVDSVDTPAAKAAAPAPATESGVDASTAPVPPVAPEPSVATAKSEANPAAQEAERTPWPELVRRGQFAAVVEAARARGVDTTLSNASARDLRALADAARYGSETSLAERALRSIRRRFPGSGESAAAAFLIGRTEESAGDLGGADRWYETYLEEARGGELAADALAGRMRVAGPLRGNEAAKALALEYLHRYPGGVHAARAKKIVGRE
jgi:TolA-binding protein